ncbi:general secretion pathway protein L [Syntrophus gentianae]|uniref:General secretion pathway protein L n=1 Tax=Syntrophus gentianae TaxID=43775 RepID=A0A1H7Z0U2_9BACT|nr:pilus assembly protein PilM [Syntrophus gentianae]SEM51986.1 general secretion pathway protein L [Syntrophus gentianae]
MNKKILGIDIGSTFLKAVALKCDLTGRVTVTASALIDMEAAGGLETSLRKLFADKSFKNGDCVFSIPARSCSFRNLSLPFTEEKTIDEIITYELEPHLPDPIETVIVDSLPLSSAGGSTEVLAAAARRQDIQKLSQYAEGHSIAVIDTDAVPVALNLLDTDIPDDSWILLDIGDRSSVAVFVQKKSIVHVRSFSWGMAELAETGMEQTDSLHDDESQSGIKQANGTRPASPEAHGRPFQRFQEIVDTLQLLAVKGLLEAPSAHIYLTGGGVLDEALRKDLESFFKLPVLVVDLLKRRGIALQGKNPMSWNAPLMNQALALALRGMTASRGFNFRKDETVSKKKPQGIRGHLLWTAAMVVIFFLCLATWQIAHYYADSRKLSNLKAEITKTFKSSCPEVTRIVDPVRQLQQKINEAKNVSGGMENGPLFLEQWKKAMDALHENSGILVSGINYNSISLEISGEASDYQVINNWKNELEKARSFADIQMQFGGNKDKDAKNTFRLRMTHVH